MENQDDKTTNIHVNDNSIYKTNVKIDSRELKY